MKRRIIVQAEYDVDDDEVPSDIATSLECLNWSGTYRAVLDNVCVWFEDGFVEDAAHEADASSDLMAAWLERMANLGRSTVQDAAVAPERAADAPDVETPAEPVFGLNAPEDGRKTRVPEKQPGEGRNE